MGRHDVSKPRYAARRDDNEKPLVVLARAIGGVWIYAPPFDGWLCWRGQWKLVEVKNPNCEGHADEYTDDQIKLMANLKARGIRWEIWRTENDVYQTVGARWTA